MLVQSLMKNTLIGSVEHQGVEEEREVVESVTIRNSSYRQSKSYKMILVSKENSPHDLLR